MLQQKLFFVSAIALIVFVSSCSEDPVSGIHGPSGSTIDTVWTGKVLAIEPESTLEPGSGVTCSVDGQVVNGFVSPLGKAVFILPDVALGDHHLQLSSNGLSFVHNVHVVPSSVVADPRVQAFNYSDRMVAAKVEMGLPEVRSLIYAQNYYEVDTQLRTLKNLIDSANEQGIGLLGTMIGLNPELFAMREIVGERLGSKLYEFQGLPFSELYTAETNDIETKVFAADVLLTLSKHDYAELSFLAKWACKTGATTNAVFLRAMSQFMNRRPMVVSGLWYAKAYGKGTFYNGRLTRCSFTTEVRSLKPSDATASPTGEKLMDSFEGFEPLWQIFRSSYGDLQGDVFNPFSIDFFPMTFATGYEDNTIVTAVRAIDDDVETAYQVHEDKSMLRMTDATLPKDTSRSKAIRLECELRVVDDIRILDTVVVYLNPYELVDSIVPLEFVAIPPGTFLMGSENGELDEQPVHEVVISRGFEMSKYPLTAHQLLSMAEQDDDIDENLSGRVFSGPNQTGTYLSRFIFDVLDFLNDQNDGFHYRLPTEAEWEYACRAGSTTTYPWGNNETDAGKYVGDSDIVGTKLPNDFGLHDMIARCCPELVSDIYDTGFYSKSPQIDPANGSFSHLSGEVNMRGLETSSNRIYYHDMFGVAIRLVRVPK